MALPAQFLEELRARTPLAALIGRRVRLAKSGRQWKGCCPFHGEKSPSFYVYDDHFHCFGCGAHGDAITFVMQSQGSGFMEAVEALSGEAGLDVPKATPEAAEAERRRHDLHSVLAAAAAFFQRRLAGSDGARGRDYLRGRGLTDATIARFGLGWSGDGRGGLVNELRADGIEPGMLLEAGLLRETEEGPPRELFYNRVMFPIADRRGRIISFGGRILGDGQPKYVNGPETPVFSKRRGLYAQHLARDAARQGQPVLVVEGYMDVISLHQAGLGGAVAPLGTALTSEQLEEIWRLAPAPTLCFDGDKAGRNAARRALETALPGLTPAQTLRILTLPPGEDPDTLVRTDGGARLRAMLDAAPPLAETMFALMREATGDATPEQRAALRDRLVETAGKIEDKSLATEYRSSLLDQFFALRNQRKGPAKPFTPRQPNGRGGKPGYELPPLVQGVVRSAPVAGDATAERGRNLIAILLRHPDLLHDVDEALSRLTLAPEMDRLRHAILQGPILHGGEGGGALDSAQVIAHLHHSGLAAEVAQALSAVPVPLPACARPDAMPAEAEAGWWHIFGLMDPGRLEEEVAAARNAFAASFDLRAQERVVRLVTALDALRKGEHGL